MREPIPPLLAIAKQAGFTQQSFEKCINDTALLNKVQQERDRGSTKFKVDATPTFFINGAALFGRDVDRRDRQDYPALAQGLMRNASGTVATIKFRCSDLSPA